MKLISQKRKILWVHIDRSEVLKGMVDFSLNDEKWEFTPMKESSYLARNTNEPVGNAGMSQVHLTLHGTQHFVTHPNICIEAHVIPEHLCPIWITSMTPVQMVTGCDHLVSPVPIHLPVNSFFDTLCLLFVRGSSHDCRHFEKSTRKKGWAESPLFSESCETSHHTHCTSHKNFWPDCGRPWVTS